MCRNRNSSNTRKNSCNNFVIARLIKFWVVHQEWVKSSKAIHRHLESSPSVLNAWRNSQPKLASVTSRKSLTKSLVYTILVLVKRSSSSSSFSSSPSSSTLSSSSSSPSLKIQICFQNVPSDSRNKLRFLILFHLTCLVLRMVILLPRICATKAMECCTLARQHCKSWTCCYTHGTWPRICC